MKNWMNEKLCEWKLNEWETEWMKNLMVEWIKLLNDSLREWWKINKSNNEEMNEGKDKRRTEEQQKLTSLTWCVLGDQSTIWKYITCSLDIIVTSDYRLTLKYENLCHMKKMYASGIQQSNCLANHGNFYAEQRENQL